MTWVRLDDGFAAHPKIAALPDNAFRLHIAALCYCATHLTDGFVPYAAVPLFGIRRVPVAGGALLELGLWDKVEGGYQIHDYLHYQESREKVMSRREATRERVNRHRQKRPGNGDTNGVGNETPDPSRSTYISSPSGGQAPDPPDEEQVDFDTAAEIAARKLAELKALREHADAT